MRALRGILLTVVVIFDGIVFSGKQKVLSLFIKVNKNSVVILLNLHWLALLIAS